jgi:hypothetical protein
MDVPAKYTALWSLANPQGTLLNLGHDLMGMGYAAVA